MNDPIRIQRRRRDDDLPAIFRNNHAAGSTAAQPMGDHAGRSEPASPVLRELRVSRESYQASFGPRGYDPEGSALADRAADLRDLAAGTEDPAVAEVATRYAELLEGINTSLGTGREGRRRDTEAALADLGALEQAIAGLGPEHAGLQATLGAEASDLRAAIESFEDTARQALSGDGQAANSAASQLAPHVVRTLFRATETGMSVSGALGTYAGDVAAYRRRQAGLQANEARLGTEYTTREAYVRAQQDVVNGGPRRLREGVTHAANEQYDRWIADQAVTPAESDAANAALSISSGSSRLEGGGDAEERALRLLDTGRRNARNGETTDAVSRAEEADGAVKPILADANAAREDFDAAAEHLDRAYVRMGVGNDALERANRHGEALEDHPAARYLRPQVERGARARAELTRRGERLAERIQGGAQAIGTGRAEASYAEQRATAIQRDAEALRRDPNQSARGPAPEDPGLFVAADHESNIRQLGVGDEYVARFSGGVTPALFGGESEAGIRVSLEEDGTFVITADAALRGTLSGETDGLSGSASAGAGGEIEYRARSAAEATRLVDTLVAEAAAATIAGTPLVGPAIAPWVTPSWEERAELLAHVSAFEVHAGAAAELELAADMPGLGGLEEVFAGAGVEAEQGWRIQRGEDGLELVHRMTVRGEVNGGVRPSPGGVTLPGDAGGTADAELSIERHYDVPDVDLAELERDPIGTLRRAGVELLNPERVDVRLEGTARGDRPGESGGWRGEVLLSMPEEALAGNTDAIIGIIRGEEGAEGRLGRGVKVVTEVHSFTDHGDRGEVSVDVGRRGGELGWEFYRRDRPYDPEYRYSGEGDRTIQNVRDLAGWRGYGIDG